MPDYTRLPIGEKACDAFDGVGCCPVGSTMQRPDWRDAGVRFIMTDQANLRSDHPHSHGLQ
jgi:hypothetical protein